MRKISNLEKLLKSDNVNGSIMTLDEFISELCKYGEGNGQTNGTIKNILFKSNIGKGS
jgi:hypothetical protein